MQSLMPVILSGGSGTRLWPLSREKHPKQLLSLINEEYRFVVAEQLRIMGRKASILLEPTGRNTAPALTLAALAALHDDNDPVLLVMPSDHVIVDTDSFQAVVLKGMRQAIDGAIVTFGITPDRPETGYGYIQSGETTGHEEAIYHIARFVEKPDITTAQGYLDAGTYLWNRGLFMMRASVWIAAIGKCRANILTVCRTAWEQGSIDGDFLRVNKNIFEQCPRDSIDYAVMERITTYDRPHKI